MPHKLMDLHCNKCNCDWEILVMPDECEADYLECPKCHSRMVSQVLGGHKTKCHDPAVKEQVLRKRSIDHSNKHAKENLEKLQNKGVLRMK